MSGSPQPSASTLLTLEQMAEKVAMDNRMQKLVETLKTGTKPDFNIAALTPEQMGQRLLIVGGGLGYDEKQVIALIEAGAKLDERNEGGSTVLMQTAALGKEEVVRLLIEKDPTLPHARSDNGITALHVASTPGIVRILVAAGAELEARDKQGRTPLMCAVLNGRHDAVASLLARGAVPDARDNKGRTALERLRQMLEDHAENPQRTADAYGDSQLAHAARESQRKIVHILEQATLEYNYRREALEQYYADGMPLTKDLPVATLRIKKKQAP